MEPKRIFDKIRVTLKPATYNGKQVYYKTATTIDYKSRTEEILDGLNIKDIESYLRRKKLQNLEGVK